VGTYDEGVVNGLQDVLLILDVVHVLALNDVVLLHGLQGELFRLVLLEIGDLYISKGAYNPRVSILSKSGNIPSAQVSKPGTEL
jgi:hypothetical protein